MERRELLKQASVSHHQMPLPCDNLTQLSDLASQLKKNAADDYRVYHRIACALRRGVSWTDICCIMLLPGLHAPSCGGISCVQRVWTIAGNLVQSKSSCTVNVAFAVHVEVGTVSCRLRISLVLCVFHGAGVHNQAVGSVDGTVIPIPGCYGNPHGSGGSRERVCFKSRPACFCSDKHFGSRMAPAQQLSRTDCFKELS